MEYLKLALAIIAGALIGTGAIVLTIVLIKARVTTTTKDLYDCEISDDLAEYEASLSGLSVEEIREQHRDIKRGVKK